MNWLILNCLTGIYSICSIQISPHVFCWDLRHLQHSNIPPRFLLGSTPFAAFKYPPPFFAGTYAVCSIQIPPPRFLLGSTPFAAFKYYAPPPVFCWDLRHLQHSNIPPPGFCWDLRHLQHSNTPPPRFFAGIYAICSIQIFHPPVSIKISPPHFCWDLRHLQHLNIPPSVFCWDLLYAICSILIPPPPPPIFDGIYTICSIQIPPARFLLGSTPFAAFRYPPFSCWDLRHLQHSNTPPPSFFKYPLPFFAGIIDVKC